MKRMKRLLLGGALLGATVAPALAGSGGAAFDNPAPLLIEQVSRLFHALAGSLAGWF
jgi:hypothetical protein